METPIAGEQPVEKAQDESTSQSDVQQNEQTEPSEGEKALAEANAKISQLETERENYRTGLLKEKGKLSDYEFFDENGQPITIRDLVNKTVEEKLIDKRLEEAHAEREAILQKTLQENAELKRALANKPPNAPSAMGSNQDKPKVEQSVFTPEQEAYIRSKGLDPKEVAKNLPQGGSLPGQMS